MSEKTLNNLDSTRSKQRTRADKRTPKKVKKERITWKTLRYMMGIAAKNRPSLFFIYAAQFAVGIVEKMKDILIPKFLIDEIALIIGGADITEHIGLAAVYAGIYVGIYFLNNASSTVLGQLKDLSREYLDELFRVMLSEQAMGMDFEHTEDPEVLDCMNKAKEGISWYSGGCVGVLDEAYQILLNVGVLAGVMVIIITTCPLLLPVQIASLVLMGIFNQKNNKIETEDFARLSKLNRVFGYVLYTLADFQYGKEVRLYDSADMMLNKGRAFSDEQVQIWREQARAQRKNSWTMDIVNSVRDGLSYFYIGWLAVTGVISVGDFSMCVSSAASLYWSLANSVSGMQDIIKKCAYAYKFVEFMSYPSAMPKGTRSVADGEHSIELRNVGFKYPRSDRFILRNINLTIKQGEHLSVVGLNGAGKTTFIKLLCRLYDVTEGEILLDGVNIREYSDEEYRRLFSVVFQDFQLFAFSLRENITLGGEADDGEIERVLKLSGFYDDALKLDNGLDTMLFKSFDEKGTELSGGQQQKTAISRALYRNAPIVILDEPTAALDPIAEYDIYRRFDSLVGGKTAIYISHRLSSCRFCDRIAVFANETISEYGTHDELVGIPNGIYAEMFAAQAQYYIDTAEQK